MDDIRIKFGLIGHPKLEKLKLMIGDQALERLITLWIRVAQNKPRGNLKDLDDMDIALYAGYKGDASEFVSALKNCKWLKDNGNGLEIQDWKEHQPWVYHSPERSERARQAALVRWGDEQDAKSMQEACETHKERNAPSPTPNPSPNPKPNPKKFIPPSLDDVVSYFQENGYSNKSAKQAFEYYNVADWHDSTGKKIKNWKQKMRGVWFKDENKEGGIKNKKMSSDAFNV